MTETLDPPRGTTVEYAPDIGRVGEGMPILEQVHVEERVIGSGDLSSLQAQEPVLLVDGNERTIDIKCDKISFNGVEIDISKLLSAYTTLSERVSQLERIEANQQKIIATLEKVIEHGTVPNLQECLR